MRNAVLISYASLMERYRLTQLTGAELYQQYGIKQNEVLFGDYVTFENNYTMEIEMVTGEEDERPDYRIQLVSSAGIVVADVSEDYDNDSLLGTFMATDIETGMTYYVYMNMERCAIPIRYRDVEGKEIVSYCDSGWLTNRFANKQENLLRFLNSYTQEEALGLVSDAILANAVVFRYSEGRLEPFDFPKQDGWKYQAFAKAVSAWLTQKHLEKSKELEDLLTL